jgi:indole-3-glycerol phosphate synthase
MKDFLSRILTTKREEVYVLKANKYWTQESIKGLPPTRSLAKAITLTPDLSVIAEVKKASPSKGLIQAEFAPATRAQVYAGAGAAAISVLTDETYFKGSITDLTQITAVVDVPILRKDFIIDEVQIEEARMAGADAVLLIVRALDPMRLQELSLYAQAMDLDVLIEVHDLAELTLAVQASPSVVGVNNRDLRTFAVKLDTAEAVIKEVPKTIPAIAESGIRTIADAQRMKAAGATGILVGETLMRYTDAREITAQIEELTLTDRLTNAHAGELTC